MTDNYSNLSNKSNIKAINYSNLNNSINLSEEVSDKQINNLITKKICSLKNSNIECNDSNNVKINKIINHLSFNNNNDIITNPIINIISPKNENILIKLLDNTKSNNTDLLNNLKINNPKQLFKNKNFVNTYTSNKISASTINKLSMKKFDNSLVQSSNSSKKAKFTKKQIDKYNIFKEMLEQNVNFSMEVNNEYEEINFKKKKTYFKIRNSNFKNKSNNQIFINTKNNDINNNYNNVYEDKYIQNRYICNNEINDFKESKFYNVKNSFKKAKSNENFRSCKKLSSINSKSESIKNNNNLICNIDEEKDTQNKMSQNYSNIINSNNNDKEIASIINNNIKNFKSLVKKKSDSIDRVKYNNFIKINNNSIKSNNSNKSKKEDSNNNNLRNSIKKKLINNRRNSVMKRASMLVAKSKNPFTINLAQSKNISNSINKEYSNKSNTNVIPKNYVLNNSSDIDNLDINQKKQKINLIKEYLKSKYVVKNLRILYSFKNVYDSFDSNNEEIEYEYEYYKAKWYSIEDNSKLSLIYKSSLNIFYYVIIFYYSTLLVTANNYNVNNGYNLVNKSVVVSTCIIEVLLLIKYIIKYFLMSYLDIHLNKQNYNPICIFKYNVTDSPIKFVIDTFLCAPYMIALILASVITNSLYYIRSESGNSLILIDFSNINYNSYDNSYLLIYNFANNSKYSIKVLLSIYYISKLLFIVFLFKWIHYISLFDEEYKDDINFEQDTYTKRNKYMLYNNTFYNTYIISMILNKYVLFKNIFIRLFKAPMIKIVLFFILFLHIVSSLWIFIGNQNNLNHNNEWIYYYNFTENTIFSQYILSLYFSLTTLLTVGYGDIVPRNSLERVFIIGCLIFGCLIYSFLISIVSSLFTNKHAKKVLLENKLTILDSLRREYKLDYYLVRYIERHIKFHFKNWHGDKEELINNLPYSLKVLLHLKIYENLLVKIDFFQNIDNKKFLLSFTSKLRTIKYFKNETILDVNDKIQDIFFVNQGGFTVNFPIDVIDCKLAKISEGKNYGNILMYMYNRSPYRLEVYSSSCTLVCLSEYDFKNLKLEFENIILGFLEDSYIIHYYIELKRIKAIDYYYKNFHLSGFEFEFQKYINIMIVNDVIGIMPLEKRFQKEDFNKYKNLTINDIANNKALETSLFKSNLSNKMLELKQINKSMYINSLSIRKHFIIENNNSLYKNKYQTFIGNKNLKRINNFIDNKVIHSDFIKSNNCYNSSKIKDFFDSKDIKDNSSNTTKNINSNNLVNYTCLNKLDKNNKNFLQNNAYTSTLTYYLSKNKKFEELFYVNYDDNYCKKPTRNKKIAINSVYKLITKITNNKNFKEDHIDFVYSYIKYNLFKNNNDLNILDDYKNTPIIINKDKNYNYKSYNIKKLLNLKAKCNKYIINEEINDINNLKSKEINFIINKEKTKLPFSINNAKKNIGYKADKYKNTNNIKKVSKFVI